MRKFALGPVMVDYRRGLFFIDFQAIAHGVGTVVGTAFGLGATGQTIDQQFLVDFQLDRQVHRLADPVEQHVERVGLSQIARIAVEDETIDGIALLEAIFEHAEHDLVRDQIAGRHDRLGLQSQRRARRHRGAQQLAGGDVRNLQVLAQARRLGALARTGRA